MLGKGTEEKELGKEKICTAPLLVKCGSQVEKERLEGMLRRVGVRSAFHWSREMLEFVDEVRGWVEGMGYRKEEYFIKVRLFFLTAVAISIATRPFKFREMSVSISTRSFVFSIHSFAHRTCVCVYEAWVHLGTVHRVTDIHVHAKIVLKKGGTNRRKQWQVDFVHRG